ncbi:MAG: ABC transporter permease subunit, partial [Thermoguttaceae bacterium]|nr:ABC transporter permease subunit [Thermoguttaceae bacterium]
NGATGEKRTPEGKLIIESIEQLDSAEIVIGGEIGTVSLTTAEERFPKAKIANYQAPADAYLALKAGKIDFVAYDRPPLEYAASQNPEFVVLPDAIGVGHIAVGGPFKNRELMNRVNEFIEKYRADGTYAEMYDRWIKTPNPQMPDIPKAENPTETIVIGFDPQNEPMSFLDANNEACGFDAEFIKRLCLFLNVDYRLENMYYDALFPAVESEKLDLAIANLDATPERAETMLFSIDYLDCPAGLMTLKDRYAGGDAADANASAPETLPFWPKLQRSFRRTFITDNRWRLILGGLWLTIVITALSAVLGTFFAFLLCCARRSHHLYLQIPAKIYISVIQGTPILVILLIFYYIIFAKISSEGFFVGLLAISTGLDRSEAAGALVASIAFAINFASYAGEMMRTGVNSIDRGLIEAAKALGFGRFGILRKIVLPLATRNILPVYRGELVSLLKTTSIVGYIAIQDLTKVGDYIRSRTYEAFFPLIATAIIYFAAAYLLASGLAYLEYRLNPITRRRSAQRRANS